MYNKDIEINIKSRNILYPKNMSRYVWKGEKLSIKVIWSLKVHYQGREFKPFNA
jgi:hypothetical protein